MIYGLMAFAGGEEDVDLCKYVAANVSNTTDCQITAEEVIAEREGLLLNPPKSPLGEIIEREMKIMIETYKKAIETFGEDSQIDMAIEEMSELTKALLKHRRVVKSGNDVELQKIVAKNNISEEMADVYIMLEQLCLIFDNWKGVEVIIKAKTDRLAERIKERRGE